MFLSEYHETLSLTSLPFPHSWLGKKKKTNMVFCSQGLTLSLNGLVLSMIPFCFYSTLDSEGMRYTEWMCSSTLGEYAELG